jgi:hypothetical protein
MFAKHWTRVDRRGVLTVNRTAIDMLGWVLLARGTLIIGLLGELLGDAVW